jgi:glutaredoxin
MSMSGKKKRVEVFIAGCPVCDEAVRLVKELACEDCEVIVYNLNEPCESGECLEKVKSYGVTRVPAVAVDGRLAECCEVGSVTKEGLKAAGIGAQK